jgi:hypothetical protein
MNTVGKIVRGLAATSACLFGLLASSPTTGPVSVTVSPSPSPAPVSQNYPSPYPAWPNGDGFNTQINATKAAANIKSYDSAATSFYYSYCSGSGSACWNSVDSSIETGGTANGSIYFAATGDPTYTFTCDGSAYCGFSNNISNIHIPLGAVTENHNNPGHTCDCHIHLIEPLGWVPASTNGTTWPNVSPNRYLVDLEDASNSTSCVDVPYANGSNACTLFNTSSGGHLYATGAEIYSTGSTGFGGTSSNNLNNDGFEPANAPPSTGWTGSSDHGNIASIAETISAADVYSGAINHEVGLRVVCAENSASDAWPDSNTTDESCNSITSGKAGWDYNDHIWLERTDAQIASDVSSGTLNQMQGILAKALAHYGAVVYDTGYSGAPAFGIDMDDDYSVWAQVATKYSLSTSTSSGATFAAINMALPMSYMKSYAHAINSCVVRNTC